jgi:hypothetical protein
MTNHFAVPLRPARFAGRSRKAYNTKARAPIQAYRNAYTAAMDGGATPEDAHKAALASLPPESITGDGATGVNQAAGGDQAAAPTEAAPAGETPPEAKNEAAALNPADATIESRIPVRKLAPKTKATLGA